MQKTLEQKDRYFAQKDLDFLMCFMYIPEHGVAMVTIFKTEGVPSGKKEMDGDGNMVDIMVAKSLIKSEVRRSRQNAAQGDCQERKKHGRFRSNHRWQMIWQMMKPETNMLIFFSKGDKPCDFV